MKWEEGGDRDERVGGKARYKIDLRLHSLRGVQIAEQLAIANCLSLQTKHNNSCRPIFYAIFGGESTIMTCYTYPTSLVQQS